MSELNSKKDIKDKLVKWCGVIPERGALNTQELYRREYAQHTEIKLTYEGEVGERIPAYLLIPRDESNTRHPAIYAAHQCACQCDIGKEQVVGKSPAWPDQAYGLELVLQGYVVLAPDANKVGERCDVNLRQAWETASDGEGQKKCCTAPGGPWGPIRWKPVFDVMRGVDYLCELDCVDQHRIGMIGHSMGADLTIWAMPFEERIKAAAISGGGILADDWFPYGVPYEDILSLIAPRAFFEFTEIKDREAYAVKKRAIHTRVRSIYQASGVIDRLGYMELNCEHSFPTEARQAAYAFLKKHLFDG